MGAERREAMIRLAAALRAARNARALSQEQVAHAAGIAVATYAQLERGESRASPNPTLRTLARVGRVLQTDLVAFLSREAPSSE